MSDGTDWVAIHWPQLMTLMFASGTAGQVTLCICIFTNISKNSSNMY